MKRWAKLEILPLLVVLTVLGYMVAGADLEGWKILFAFFVFSLVPSAAAIFYGHAVASAPESRSTQAHIQSYLDTIRRQNGVLSTCGQLLGEAVQAIEATTADDQLIRVSQRLKKMTRYLSKGEV